MAKKILLNIEENAQPILGNVLVVEDQLIYSKLLLKYLSQLGFNGDTAPNGATALEMLDQEHDFDLVILDLMLPDIDGFEVCRKLREKYSLFDLPILLLTAADDVNDKVIGFSAGANDFLSKPYDKNELIARAKTLVNLKKIAVKNFKLKEAIEKENMYHRMTIHDIKNPLTSIIALSSFMKDDLGDAFEHSETVDIICRSSEKILAMLTEFLEMSRLESGAVSLHLEEVDCNYIANIVNESNIPYAHQKQQNLIFNPGPKEFCYVKADPGRLQQILDNLVSNAVKYSPIGENINTSVVLVENTVPAPVIRIEVQDNGPGFSEQESKKLFQKFSKLSSIPTAGESSSGLGLSIAKELVEMHKGRIWAESQPGHGAKFIIELSALKK
jgi:signal transduction histidine kinase